MTMFPTNIMGEELIKKANEYAKEYKFFFEKETANRHFFLAPKYEKQISSFFERRPLKLTG